MSRKNSKAGKNNIETALGSVHPVLLLGLTTTVVSIDTRVLNACLKRLNCPAARHAKTWVSWYMLLKIAGKIPRMRERGARIGYPGRKGRPGRNLDPTRKSFYKSRKRIV